MEKLVLLLMILLFAVGLTTMTIYDDNGIQSDALEMKGNTTDIIKDANTQMTNFSGTTPTN